MNLPNTNTIFHDSFSNRTETIKQGGTLTGSPVYMDGLHLNGVDQYATYQIANTLLSHPQISFIVEFIPDFEADSNSSHTIFDISDTNDDYLLAKQDSAQSNELRLDLGNTTIADVPLTTYQPYWRVSQRNIIVISSESGSTNIWLNGSQIVSNDVTAWTPSYVSNIYIGSLDSANWFFDGTIKSFSIHNRLFTQGDVTSLQNNSLYNYQDKASVWLDMKSQVGEPSGNNKIVGGMDVSGWTVESGAVLSNPSSDVLRSVGGVNSGARQTIASSGERFQVSGYFRGDGVTSARPYVLFGSVSIAQGTTSNEWQYFSEIGIANGAYFRFWNAGTTGTIEFKEVSFEYIHPSTKDKSGNGNHFLLGEDSDSTTQPSFSAPGFLTDGGNYLQSANSGLLDTSIDAFSIVCVVDKGVVQNAKAFLSYEGPGLTNFGCIFLCLEDKWQFYAGGVSGNITANSDHRIATGKEVLIGTTTGTQTSIWVNGEQGIDAVTPFPIILTTEQKLTLFARGNGSTSFASSGGKVYHVSMFPFKLSPIQIAHITSYLMGVY